jgi:hypothetical protein
MIMGRDSSVPVLAEPAGFRISIGRKVLFELLAAASRELSEAVKSDASRFEQMRRAREVDRALAALAGETL